MAALIEELCDSFICEWAQVARLDPDPPREGGEERVSPLEAQDSPAPAPTFIARDLRPPLRAIVAPHLKPIVRVNAELARRKNGK